MNISERETPPVRPCGWPSIPAAPRRGKVSVAINSCGVCSTDAFRSLNRGHESLGNAALYYRDSDVVQRPCSKSLCFFFRYLFCYSSFLVLLPINKEVSKESNCSSYQGDADVKKTVARSSTTPERPQACHMISSSDGWMFLRLFRYSVYLFNLFILFILSHLCIYFLLLRCTSRHHTGKKALCALPCIYSYI